MLFRSNYIDDPDILRCDENSHFEDYIGYSPRVNLIKRKRSKLPQRCFKIAEINPSEIELNKDSMTRPGEINNSELKGAFPGSLKNGLMVLLIYKISIKLIIQLFQKVYGKNFWNGMEVVLSFQGK